MNINQLQYEGGDTELNGSEGDSEGLSGREG